MKNITLKSRWNDLELKIRVPDNVYSKLSNSEDPMAIINEACDRVHYGYHSEILTDYQAKKINNFFAANNVNYFCEVEL